MGEVQGVVGGARIEAQQPAGQKQFVVAQAPVLAPEHQGHRQGARGRSPRLWGGTSPQPVKGCGWAVQGQGRPLQAAGGGHHPTTIGQGGRQVGEQGSTLQHGLGMNGHLAGLRPQRITAGRHQAQFGHPEIGAQPGHAA